MDEKNAELHRERSRATFDAQAATYDAGMEGEHARQLYPHVIAEVRRAVAGSPSPRLLDLGCGTGALAERVLEEVPGARLICVDLSPRMVEAARARLGDRAEVLLGDAERLPFHEASFDAVWCNDSFHHYPDPERAAFQAWRVLVPGGALVVGDVWQPAPTRAIMNAWMPRSREATCASTPRRSFVASSGPGSPRWAGVEWARLPALRWPARARERSAGVTRHMRNRGSLKGRLARDLGRGDPVGTGFPRFPWGSRPSPVRAAVRLRLPAAAAGPPPSSLRGIPRYVVTYAAGRCPVRRMIECPRNTGAMLG